MLHMKTTDTSPVLAVAKARHAANEAAHDAAITELQNTRLAAVQHDNAAAAADSAAVEHGNTLAGLVGANANESERVPVRAAHADEVARAAYHRQQAQAKRAQLPELESAVSSTGRAARDGSGLHAAEFNDALAAYVEHLPELEPIVTRLRAAADALGRQIRDEAHQFSALPKIQGGHIFGQRIEREHYTA